MVSRVSKSSDVMEVEVAISSMGGRAQRTDQRVRTGAGRSNRNGGAKPTAGDTDAASGGNLDKSTQGHLGRIIKESYSDLLRQPVPDRFLEILKDLERTRGEPSEDA